MNKIRLMCAAAIVAAVLAVSASGGQIDSPGAVPTPTPTPSPTATTSTSSTTMTVILTILNLFR